MMNDMSLKAKVRNIAKEKKISAQAVLQNYLMRRFLFRLSKAETILSRGIDNTRPRDFYDICVLSAYDYDNAVFRDAFEATSKHRGSFDKISDYDGILSAIEKDPVMQGRWKAYSSEMMYARDISFADTMAAIRQLMR